MKFNYQDLVLVMKPGTTAEWVGYVVDWEAEGITLKVVTKKGNDALTFLPWALGIVVTKNLTEAEISESE